jgi:hypothetical protein
LLPIHFGENESLPEEPFGNIAAARDVGNSIALAIDLPSATLDVDDLFGTARRRAETTRSFEGEPAAAPIHKSAARISLEIITN